LHIFLVYLFEKPTDVKVFQTDKRIFFNLKLLAQSFSGDINGIYFYF